MQSKLQFACAAELEASFLRSFLLSKKQVPRFYIDVSRVREAVKCSDYQWHSLDSPVAELGFLDADGVTRKIGWDMKVKFDSESAERSSRG